MATRNEGKSNVFTFLWKIENISCCWWMKKSKPIVSLNFIVEALEKTKWLLALYPISEEDENDISLYLYRDRDCSGPDIVKVKYQLAFLDKDGLILKEETKTYRFKKDSISGFEKFEKRERVFLTDREEFLPEDTLTIQCTLQKAKGTLVKSGHSFRRTIWNVNRKSLYWRIDKFSAVQPGVRKNYKDDLIELDLILNEDFEKKLDMNIISFDDNIQYISCNTSIIDLEGKMENCGITKYLSEDLKKEKLSITLHFPKLLTENKSRYLKNDVLTFHFQFAFTTVEYFDYETKLNQLEENAVVKGRFESIVILIDELKSLYKDEIFYDIQLRTQTKTFRAHKNILSARSPVFRNMLKHDMKEKNSGQVDITDLEDDTIHRMLLFLYTTDIEDLQIESASKLYEAADKYEILSLKCRCSSFLKRDLCPANACRILILADLHNDDDLKNAVQDYILGQRSQIFHSQEWKDFMNNHSKLAADVMHKRMCQE